MHLCGVDSNFNCLPLCVNACRRARAALSGVENGRSYRSCLERLLPPRHVRPLRNVRCCHWLVRAPILAALLRVSRDCAPRCLLACKFEQKRGRSMCVMRILVFCGAARKPAAPGMTRMVRFPQRLHKILYN